MMKGKYLVIALLIAALALGGVGCVGNKATGGGWFIDDYGAGKVTFGFTGQPTEEQIDGTAPWPPEPWPPGGENWPPENWEQIGAKGQFQLVAHDTETEVHGMFEGTFAYTQPETNYYFWGTCSVDGEELSFWVSGVDDDEVGDEILIGIGGDPGNLLSNKYLFGGNLEGGNIRVHKAKNE